MTTNPFTLRAMELVSRRFVLADVHISNLDVLPGKEPVTEGGSNQFTVLGRWMGPVTITLIPNPEIPIEDFFGFSLDRAPTKPQMRQLSSGLWVLQFTKVKKPDWQGDTNLNCYIAGQDPAQPMGLEEKSGVALKRLQAFQPPAYKELQQELKSGDFIARPIPGQPGGPSIAIKINSYQY